MRMLSCQLRSAQLIQIRKSNILIMNDSGQSHLEAIKTRMPSMALVVWILIEQWAQLNLTSIRTLLRILKNVMSTFLTSNICLRMYSVRLKILSFCLISKMINYKCMMLNLKNLSMKMKTSKTDLKKRELMLISSKKRIFTLKLLWIVKGYQKQCPRKSTLEWIRSTWPNFLNNAKQPSLLLDYRISMGIILSDFHLFVKNLAPIRLKRLLLPKIIWRRN